ncbi:hypothetical protein Z946_1645 [Sulfitobacter noctilucicola]|nr:hypothetical protein Z946_1645 [Sulfitobacter noctilucicola]
MVVRLNPLAVWRTLAYMAFNSGAFGSKPNAPPILNTGRAPVFLCLMIFDRKP